MYELNGFTYSLQEIEEAANNNGLSIQDYINENGLKLVKREKDDIVNPERKEEGGFMKILNSVGDYIFGEEGTMSTAWQNGTFRADAYDGINDAFGLDPYDASTR